MNRRQFPIAYLILTSVVLIANCSSVAAAEWTILIYMNGKNNLESDAINNFLDIADSVDGEDVEVIVEMGRPQVHYDYRFGAWSGVRRFLITKGMRPTADSALLDVAEGGGTTDMGSPQALESFLQWALVERFTNGKKPNSKTLLIIWNHGQGWRFQLAGNRALKKLVPKDAGKNDPEVNISEVVTSVPVFGGFRSVSSDEDTGNILFNSDVAATLEKYFKEPEPSANRGSVPGGKLDILGFDACLMSMIETGYAFTRSSELMIGSQELEPGDGWPYRMWLPQLVANPTMGRDELAKLIVQSYSTHYGDDGLTTLSAVRLGDIRALAKSVSELADRMSGNLATERSSIQAARSGMRTYGDIKPYLLFTSIDLDWLLERYRKNTKDSSIRDQIDVVRLLIKGAVLANYASLGSQSEFGSRGLAIYFPETKAKLLMDPESGGYDKTNSAHPVEFVRQERWSDFLSGYLR